MAYTKNTTLVDPFEVWKRMRNERYAKYRWVAYAVVATSLGFFVYACRKVKSLWVGLCLGQIFIILLSQLTCYYYSFLILSAPLTRFRRRTENPLLSLEVPLFSLAALTQAIGMFFFWNDDKYTALTLVSLIFCYYLLFVFARRAWGRP
jgi:hypothetical protein